jgi:cell wall-associated NlpC family hydrolase
MYMDYRVVPTIVRVTHLNDPAYTPGRTARLPLPPSHLPLFARRRRSAPGVAAVCLLTAAVASLTTGGIAHAQSTLDLTLDTGEPPSPPPAAAPAAPAPNVVVHRAMGGSSGAAPTVSRRALALASRAAATTRTTYRQAPSSAPRVLAQLGLVLSGEQQIRLDRDSSSRLLSAVPKGTYLAVVADGGDWWGVLMVNNTMGWVPKSALQMIDYQTEIAVPTNPLTQERPATRGAAGTVGGALGDLTSGGDMDGRTVALLRQAMTYLGVPYVWAGNTRAGLDCSGFVKAVFSSQGVSLPRHSGDQARVGQFVQGPDLRPGDRIYFDMGRKGAVNHCGIYLGNGYFIHASTNQRRVGIDSIYKPNYYKALVCARRS